METAEELLLLLEKAEDEGAGAAIPYVYPELPLACSQATAGHCRGLMRSWSTSTRSTYNNQFVVHTEGVGSYNPRVITNFFSPSNTRPP